MRALFFILLILNLGYFGWQFIGSSSGVGAGSSTINGIEPIVLLSEVKEAEQQAAREKEEKEKAAELQAAREIEAKEKAAALQALKEKQAKEEAARLQAAKEKEEREKAAELQAEKKREAKQKAAALLALKEKEAKEKKARLQAAKETEEREKAAKLQAEKEREAKENAAALLALKKKEAKAKEEAAVLQAAKEREEREKAAKLQAKKEKEAKEKAEKLQAAKDKAAREARVAKEKAVAASADQCFTMGPFEDLEKLRGLTRAIKSYVIEADFRGVEETLPPIYWVYTAAEKTKKDTKALAARLRKKNITDFYLLHSPDKENSISLGRFRNKKGVQRYVKKLEKLGFNVVVELVDKDAIHYWLDYRVAAGDTIPESIFKKYKPAKKQKVKRTIQQCD